MEESTMDTDRQHLHRQHTAFPEQLIGEKQRRKTPPSKASKPRRRGKKDKAEAFKTQIQILDIV
jgi:hypothetical protein